MHDVLHLFFGSQKFALTKNQRGKQLHVQQSKEANIYIGKLCPKHFFLKRIVVVVVVVVGLGGGQAFQVLSGLSDILLHAGSHNRVNKSWPATDINNNKNQQRKMTGFGKQPISYYKA